MASGAPLKAVFHELFNFRDEHAEGRCYQLMDSALSSIVSNLSSGLFYTRFLMLNGISLVNVGILTFVPYIAAVFSIFSPHILRHFPKRKGILSLVGFFRVTLNILGITLLPELVSATNTRLVCFVVITFLSSIISSLFSSGYTAWYTNFLPERHRSEFFIFRDFTTYFFGTGLTILIAFFADMVTGTPYEYAVTIGIRYLSYVLAIIEIFILSRPKEYPYLQTNQHKRISDVLNLPLKNKHFCYSMLLIFFCTVIDNLPSGVLNYHLVNSIGIPTSFFYIINVLYCLFLLAFLPFWKRILAKSGWFNTYRISTMLLFPTYIMYALVSPTNFTWLFFLLRVIQHFIGVGRNTAFANFPYINLPEKDRDEYLVFYSLGNSLSAGIGILIGTWIVSLLGDVSLTLFGYTFTAVPILLLIEGVGTIFICLMVKWLIPRIQPTSNDA